MKCIVLSFTLVICLLTCHKGYTQNITNLGYRDGLSSNQAFSVVQDKEGFIWVSTKLGIDRFDGKHFINYHLPEQIISEGYQRVNLITDQDKNLWAYTRNGVIYRFCYEHNRFKEYLNLKTRVTNAFDLRNVHIDKKIWLGVNNGLYQIGSDGAMVKVEAIQNQNANVIQNYGKNYILVGTSNLYIIDKNTNELVSYVAISSPEVSKVSRELRSICKDEDNKTLWCSNAAGNVFKVDLKDKSVIDFKYLNKDLPSFPINKIILDEDRYLLLASDGGGIMRINNGTGEIMSVQMENIDTSNSIKGNGIQDLFRDAQGNLYITSYTGGLNIIRNEEKQFHQIKHIVNLKNSLKNNVVNSILEDKDNDLWFATNDGVSLWQKSKNKWKHFFNNPKGASMVFLCLHQGDGNTIIAGSYSKGMFIIDKDNWIIRHVIPTGEATKTEENLGLYVNDIYNDKKRIWIADIFNELTFYNKVEKSFSKVGIYGSTVFENKNDSILFVGTSRGLFQVNRKNLTKQHIHIESKLPRHTFVHSLSYSKESNCLWIATFGQGIIKWHCDSDSTETYSIDTGLQSNHIHAVVKNTKDEYWVSSAGGIACINDKNKKVSTILAKHGDHIESFYSNSKLKGSDGNLYFGSYNGVTFFNPSRANEQFLDVRLFLNDFKIFNKSVLVEPESVLEQSVNKTERIELNYHQHSISFDFTTIQLANPIKIKYTWKLEGLDQYWAQPSEQQRASYTNLAPGKYIFRLKAIGSSNDNILDSREVCVIVRPSVWNTSVAKLIYSILFLLFLKFVYGFFRNADKKKLSEAKIQFFTTTAHDIRTPLSLVKAPLLDLKKSKHLNEKETYWLNLSLSNVQKLTDMVNQLLDFQKSDEGKGQLVVSKIDITQSISDRINYFRPIAQAKTIDIHFKHHAEQLFEWVDVNKWEKILNNVLSNAIKYSYDHTTIKIQLKVLPNNWFLSIEDEGIGISKTSQKQLFKGYYRGANAINSKNVGTGIGLLLTRNYVELHKGKINFESTESKGSVFSLSFKRGINHFAKNVSFIREDTKSEIIQQNFNPEVEKPICVKPSQNQKFRLLIVEDNDEMRNYLNRSLSGLYHVELAENGEQALSHIKSFSPDIIVSDVEMPIINGVELVRKVKKDFTTSHIPIILLTAYTEKEQIKKGLNTGADDYITKPFDIDLLKLRVKNLLDNRAAIQKHFSLQVDSKLPSSSNVNKRDEAFVCKSVSFVEENIQQISITRQEFAQHMNVSESLLFQKLKALTGQTPNEFIRVIKLKNAAKLLLMDEYTMSEIADLTGFSDSSYFSSSFKKFYGTSPSKYKSEKQDS